MPAIARSPVPLPAVRGFDFGWPVALSNPGTGTPLNLTGWTIKAWLYAGARQDPIEVTSVTPLAGTFRIGGTAALLDQAVGLGAPRIVIVATDAAGTPRIYEYPLAISQL